MREKTKEKLQYISGYLIGFVLMTLMLFFSMGCSPCERLSRKCPPVNESIVTIRDTSYVERVVRDTIYMATLPSESTRDVSFDTAHAETSVAVADAWVSEDGKVELWLRNKKEAEVKVPYAETRYYRGSDIVYDKTNTEVVYRMRTIWKVLSGIGIAWIIFIIFKVAWKLKSIL